MQKILSICTAAYNVEKFIDKMIKSLVTCKFADRLEIIIVNDGSTDNTLTILREYEKKYPNIIKIISKENGGSGSARNIAFSMATGKYIKIIDGDDWVVTEEFDAYIECLLDIDADMIINNHFVYYCSGKLNDKRILVDTYKEITEGVYKLENIFPYIKEFYMYDITFSTAIVQNNNITLSEGISYVDMEYMILPIPYVSTVAYIPHPFYVYQIGIEGQSSDPKIKLKKIDNKWKIVDRLIEVLNKAIEDHLPKCNIEIIKTNIESLCKSIIFTYIFVDDYNYEYISSIKQADKKIKAYNIEIYKHLIDDKYIFILRVTNYYGYYIIQILRRIKKFLKGDL